MKTASRLTACILVGAALILQGCLLGGEKDRDKGGPLDGVWIEASLAYNSDSVSDTITYGDAEILSKRIYSIRNDSVYVLTYGTDPDDTEFTHSIEAFSFNRISGKLWLIGEDTLMCNRSGNQLQFEQWYDDDELGYTHWTANLVSYSGSVPPNAWLAGGDFFEPNGSVPAAYAIDVPGFSDWHYLPAGDEDWFSFKAQGNTFYVFEAVGPSLGESGMWVMNAADSVLAESIVWTTDKGRVIQAGWTCPQTGTYYIRIINAGPSVEDSYYNFTAWQGEVARDNLYKRPYLLSQPRNSFINLISSKHVSPFQSRRHRP